MTIILNLSVFVTVAILFNNQITNHKSLENPFAYKSTDVAQTFCCLKQIALTAIKLQGENQPCVN